MTGYSYGYSNYLGGRAARGFSPDFFVDSVNGSDSNDGLTALTAKQTLTAADRQTKVFTKP